MTEYEIADLALSNAEAIRNQAALIQGQASLMQSGITMFYSMIFAYLTAAYLVGSSL